MTSSEQEKPDLPPMETAAPAAANSGNEKNIQEQYRDLISDLIGEIPPGFKPESEKDLDYKQRLEELHKKQLEASLSEKEQGEVARMKEEIDQLLAKASEAAIEPEKTVETEIIDESTDQKSIERLTRDVRLISDIEQLELLEAVPGDDAETIKRKLDKKKEITSIIERRNWGKALGKLQDGDKVITVIVPGADFLKIKHLNDEVFGYSRTSDILEYRKKLIEEQLVLSGGIKAEILKTDYQSSTLRIPSENVPEKYLNSLNVKMENIDALMTEFIEDIVEEELQKSKNDPIKTGKLNKFNDELMGRMPDGRTVKNGYRMTYGVSEVEGKTMAGRLDALNRSTQAARTARGAEGSYGTEYDKELIDTELDLIKELRSKLQDESITNSDGIEFKLFNQEKNGFLKINKDVLRDVRKDKFKAAKNSEKVLADVVKYVKKINILDSVKPFIKEETAEGGKLQKQMRDYSDLTDEFLNLTDTVPDASLTPEQQQEKTAAAEKIRNEINEIIKTEEKDHNYTSADQFNSKATEIKTCAYLSIDVMDVGVDQLQEFERLLQDVENEGGNDKDKKRKLLDEKASVAGDGATKKMREVRENIKKVLGEHGLLMDVKTGKYTKKDGLVLGHVGGDEVTLAVDMSELENRKLSVEDLMFEIKDATNHGKADVRIINTVAAEAIRDNKAVDKQSQAEIFKDHLKTIKRAEKGADIAKQVEENVRKFNLLIQREGSSAKVAEMIKEAGLEKIFKISKDQVTSFIIVTEKEDGFDVKAEGFDVDADELQQKIADIKTKLAA